MTTSNFDLRLAAFVLLLLIAWFCLPASMVVAIDEAADDLEAVQTSTSDQSAAPGEGATTSVPTLPPPKAPWFKIEQLSLTEAVGDFVVGPGRVEIELQPGQTVTYEITVANRISDGRIFDLTVEDMAGTDDGSRSVVLLGDERGPYSIRDYISFPETSFKLDLGERARIPVTISIPKDAEPGGFYGSVLVSTTKTEADPEASAKSPIVARIGTLFFVSVPGDVVRAGETLGLTLRDSKWWYESGPIKLSIAFQNSGSLHLSPSGELKIKNFFGEEVGYLELEPWFVLPQSLRNRDITWDRELLFGRYTATAVVSRGYDDLIDTVTVSFWVLPWKIVGSIFLVVFIIVFGLRAFFRKFEFKRKGS